MNATFTLPSLRRALCAAVGLLALGAGAADTNFWARLDLSRPGLRPVAEALAKGDEAAADAALLAYWRGRPDAQKAWAKATSRAPSAFDRRLADDALEHRFYAHEAYQPSYFYGKDIDWTYWPVKANELRWQLHRHKWFLPLLRVCAATGDARYFAAWRDQWADWRAKNPWPPRTPAERENARFAWRALEISDRLSGLPRQLALAVNVPACAPADLKAALAEIDRHAALVWERRADKGNHLLFEMTRLLGAADACPELKAAPVWRANALRTLKEELRRQVYPDGVQYELDLGYHLSAYKLFRDALRLAPDAFDADDRARVARMAAFADDLFFPDGEHPYFADTHSLAGRRRLLDDARKTFPEAFDRPAFASRAYPDGGFYVLREGDPETGTMVVLKAGPAAFWHNQPDNGTFSYWRAGRDFFPDAGSYLYGGPDTEAARNAFRATKAHTTLTLDDRDNAPGSRLLRWRADAAGSAVAVETPAYPGLAHRRTLELAPGGALTVRDEAIGPTTGGVAVRFALAPGADPVRLPDGSWRTRFPDGNDIRLAFPGAEGWEATVEPGWRSRRHGKKEARPILVLRKAKAGPGPIALVTQIEPFAEK